MYLSIFLLTVKVITIFIVALLRQILETLPSQHAPNTLWGLAAAADATGEACLPTYLSLFATTQSSRLFFI